MTASVASAPGKIMLAGEYAVLEGGAAVMMAVDRRASATGDRRPATDSPFLRAVAEAIERELGADSVAARVALEVTVDTSALREGDRKLGLGSSAAATVAAVACALGEQFDVLDLELVHRLAHVAHTLAQAERGSGGSGADVAASVHGDVIAVRRSGTMTLPANDGPEIRLPAPPQVERVSLPSSLILVPVWTGREADTASLVATALRHRTTAGYRAAIAEIRSAASGFIDACARGDAGGCVNAISAGAAAHAALGRAAGLELETEIHRRIAGMATATGGAAKPTGAGAGDIAIAAFTEWPQAARFRDDIVAAGMVALPLRVDPVGVRLHP